MSKKTRAGLAFFAVAAFFLITWSVARSQRPTVPTSRGSNPPLGINQPARRPGVFAEPDQDEVEVQQSTVLRSPQKPKVPVTANLVSSIPGVVTAMDVNNSMKKRRDLAWEIVTKAWAPVHVQGGKIPSWITWYEQEDIEDLYREMLNQQTRPGSRGQVSVDALLQKHNVKDLQRSLNSARLGKVLRQFTFQKFRQLAPNVKPRAGTLYYSPAYVKHLLENAANIAKCDPSAFPDPAGRLRRTSMLIEEVPAGLRPQDPNNLYALCLDHEMPPDAVMIKAAWSPVFYTPKGDDLVKEHMFTTDPTMASKLSAGPAGQWIEVPWDEWQTEHGGMKPGGFTITDEQGKEWALMGMHIVTKTLRTWMWTSLFDRGSWSWRADQPPALTKEWPIRRYGMCTVSDFKEGDPTPWAAYDGKDAFLQTQADAFKAVSQVMHGAQWCSNPYIETTMARGNCIGCHQGSTESFLPTTLFERQRFNISDFSFSFATNRGTILKIRQQHGKRLQLSGKP